MHNSLFFHSYYSYSLLKPCFKQNNVTCCIKSLLTKGNAQFIIFSLILLRLHLAPVKISSMAFQSDFTYNMHIFPE